MTLDAASSTCCCGAATGICCYPIATATMQVTVVEKFKHFFAGAVIDEVMSSLSATVVFTRVMLPSPHMEAVVINQAAYYINTNKVPNAAAIEGTSCAGQTDYYFCPPCNTFLPCSQVTYQMPAGLLGTCSVDCGSCRNILSEPVGSTYDRPLTNVRIAFPDLRNVTISGLGAVGSGCEFSSFYQTLSLDGISGYFYDQCFTLDALRNMHWSFGAASGISGQPYFLFSGSFSCQDPTNPTYPYFSMCANGIISTGGLLYSNLGHCPSFSLPSPCALIRDTPSNTLPALKNIYLATCATNDCGTSFQCFYVDCFGQLISVTQSCGCDSIVTQIVDGITYYLTDGWGTAGEGSRQFTYEREIFVTVT